ncbi:MAG: restriction endonuclease subunit S [Clostridium sp.]|nr:restriction endonuclease subunit S [Clostridium sp.]
MKVEDIFTLHNGNSFELVDMQINKESGINFVSRTSSNNGVVERVERVRCVEPFPAGAISVALSGNGVCSAFVQTRPFYTAYHVMILQPKRNMSFNEKLFYCMCIKANAYRYAWGRQANKTLKDIELPEDVPDWALKLKITPIRSSIKWKSNEIQVKDWKYFALGGIDGIFQFENCKCGNARELDDGNDIFYIGAKKNNNGVMKKVAYNEQFVTAGNCIVFICDGQGSVGYTNYMDRDFIGSTTLTVGRNKKLNKYNALFLVTVLDLEKPKYSYGRKYRKHIQDTMIKLPATKEGTPDYDYMENYIKSLPYSDKI